jgi:hypothetical protein
VQKNSNSLQLGENSARYQRRPANARMITIKRIIPSPPLGQYPQPELYGQAGNAPIKSKIRMINRIVPMVSPFSNYVREREEFWTLKAGMRMR